MSHTHQEGVAPPRGERHTSRNGADCPTLWTVRITRCSAGETVEASAPAHAIADTVDELVTEADLAWYQVEVSPPSAVGKHQASLKKPWWRAPNPGSTKRERAFRGPGIVTYRVHADGGVEASFVEGGA